MMESMLPGVFIKHYKSLSTDITNDFATLFITFSDLNFSKPMVILENHAQINEYSFLQKNEFISKSIEVFFSNKGQKLYILNFPVLDENSFDIIKFENFISRSCDNYVDIEIIVALDLYSKDLYRKVISQNNIISIQRCINVYSKKTNRFSITDITDDFDYKYIDLFGETSIYYPWIKDKSSYPLPPSVYVSALMSKFADEEKLQYSVANKELLNAVATDKVLSTQEKEELVLNRINPVVEVPHRGVRIWGTKAFDSEIDTTVELRVFKYIKRNLYKMAKVYIFEPNDNKLKDRLLVEVDGFLFQLWQKGMLLGSNKNEAYLIDTDISQTDSGDNVLSIIIALSLVKPLEYIYIELNKVAQDGNQATLSIN